MLPQAAGGASRGGCRAKRDRQSITAPVWPPSMAAASLCHNQESTDGPRPTANLSVLGQLRFLTFFFSSFNCKMSESFFLVTFPLLSQKFVHTKRHADVSALEASKLSGGTSADEF